MSADNAPKLSTGYLDRRSLVVGATLPIFISYPPGQKRPPEPVVWTLSDETVATIRPEGSLHQIIGLRPGAVTVRAAQGIHEWVDTLHVVDPSAVERVELGLEHDLKAHAANRFQLAATAFHEHSCWRAITSDAEVAWSSSDESIARLSSSGVVLGKKDGDARISIAFKGRFAHLDVHIEDGVLATFSQGLFDCGSFLRAGVTTGIFPYFEATVRDWRPRSDALTLSAEPRDVMAIANGSGDVWTIRGLRAGSATITLRLGMLHAKKQIEVREAQNPRFDPIHVEAADDRSALNLLFIGQQSAAYVYLRDDGGLIDNCHDIAWSSSAPEILSILDSKENAANVKALAEGNVILRAECKALGVKQERKLRVTEEPHIEWI